MTTITIPNIGAGPPRAQPPRGPVKRLATADCITGGHPEWPFWWLLMALLLALQICHSIGHAGPDQYRFFRTPRPPASRSVRVARSGRKD